MFPRKHLIFDPSGNWTEDKGTTGWALFVERELANFGTVSAKDYDSLEAYWTAVGELIKLWSVGNSLEGVVIESFKLFAHKAKAQSWSFMETPQIIGYLRMVCWEEGIPVEFQEPALKQGVSDGKLEHLGIFENHANGRGDRYFALGRPTVIHERDAIRHGIYYFRYGKGKHL